MRRLMRILTAILLFIILLFSISFSLLNRTPVVLDFGVTSLSAQPVSVWIISAFCLGGILGLLLGGRFLSILRNRNTIRRQRKELVSSKREINELKIALRRLTPFAESDDGASQPQNAQGRKEEK